MMDKKLPPIEKIVLVKTDVLSEGGDDTLYLTGYFTDNGEFYIEREYECFTGHIVSWVEINDSLDWCCDIPNLTKSSCVEMSMSDAIRSILLDNQKRIADNVTQSNALLDRLKEKRKGINNAG